MTDTPDSSKVAAMVLARAHIAAVLRDEHALRKEMHREWLTEALDFLSDAIHPIAGRLPTSGTVVHVRGYLVVATDVGREAVPHWMGYAPSVGDVVSIDRGVAGGVVLGLLKQDQR